MTPLPTASTSDRPVVLITGAARRLGLATALEMARAGWAIALHHHRSSADEALAQMQALGVPSLALAADLSDEAACAALVGAAVQRFGRVDAVVNNASMFEYDEVASFSYANMDAHWRANTAPAIVLARALHAHLAERDSQGCVVNMLDQKLWNPNPDYLSYTLSKAALETATTLLAQALAPRLRVAGVAPGLTLGSGLMGADKLYALQTQTPLKRGVQTADVARTVRFVIETPSITGTTILVDAGSHLAPASRDFPFQKLDDPSHSNP